MIKVTKNKKNQIALTLTEMASQPTSSTYVLNLRNNLTGNEINGIPINDISLAPERYNLFVLEPTNVETEFNVTSSITLEDNRTYVLNCDLVITNDAVLTIPENTNVIATNVYIYSGSIVDSGSIISLNDINYSQGYYNAVNLLGIDNSTIIYDLESGAYTYQCLDISGSILETGRLLVDYTTQVTKSLNVDSAFKTYKG